MRQAFRWRCIRRCFSTTRHPASAYSHLDTHLSHIRSSLLTLLEASSPALTEASQYYFLQPSKHLRPLLVLLFAQATNGLGKQWPSKRAFWDEQFIEHSYPEESKLQFGIPGESLLDRSLTRTLGVLNDWNPVLDPSGRDRFDPRAWDNGQSLTKSPKLSSSLSAESEEDWVPHLTEAILPTQTRLAEILELIHAASLLHDDVIDASSLRRGVLSAPWAFQPGAKMTVMAGTFILGRASALLSRLGDTNAIELVASIVRCLVEGEVLQMGVGNTVEKDDLSPMSSVASKRQDAWSIYLQKTYMKTASLMAKGCRAAVSLGGCVDGKEIWNEVAYAYGRNLGISFQLVDDILDFTQASPIQTKPTSSDVEDENGQTTLGKPANADLALGLATGPALYAWEEYPEMEEMIQRRFGEPGDVEKARSLILASKALERTKALAERYSNQAISVLEPLPAGLGKRGLEELARKVVTRKK